MAIAEPPLSVAPPPLSEDELPSERVVLEGVSGSAGVAVGRALVITAHDPPFVRRTIDPDEREREVTRVRSAASRAQRELRSVAAGLPSSPGTATTVLDAYFLMLADPMLHERVEEKIRRELKCAEWAVSEARHDLAKLFEGADADGADAYIAERRHDVRFVCERLLRTLIGDAASPLGLAEPMVVVARDLSPADTAAMVREPVLGFVTEIGSRTSHTSLMARALEIPSVVGVKDALRAIRSGDRVIVCGVTGTVTVHPTAEDEALAGARELRHRARAERLLGRQTGPAATACGVRVILSANIELTAESELARRNGAESVGLYRTEFHYIDRVDLPSEDEQFEAYRSVVCAFEGAPVTLRTFDVGGDKFASSFQLPPEMNPALGLRAIRLALETPAVFLVQLRAMVRAAAYGQVRVMLPMVSTITELRRARALLRRAETEVAATLGEELPAIAPLPLGVMIEVPAAAVMADVFAREADFFSVGTNDLVQYSLAIDRTSRALAHLASPLDPAIVRLLAGITHAARARPIPVSVCGAMASDPAQACLLVGLGVRELSMESAAIPEVREALSRFRLTELERLAEEALRASTTAEVVHALTRALGDRLDDLGAAFVGVT